MAVKFATLSRSGGTFIICIIISFTHVDRWNIRNIPTRKNISHANDGGHAPHSPGSVLGYSISSCIKIPGIITQSLFYAIDDDVWQRYYYITIL